MSDDIYNAPESELVTESADQPVLASRLKRLGASIIDTLLIMVVLIPAMFLTGGFAVSMSGEAPGFLYGIMMAILGLAVFVLLNGKLLKGNGQTIGKKLLNIKIVDMEGNLPTVNEHLIKRYAVYLLPGQVPFIGGLFSIVNILFIFRGDQRCIHDLVGNTQVVNA